MASSNVEPTSKYVIYLLRHGESVGNAEDLHQGHYDFPLTETGRAQVRALAQRWQSQAVTFDRMVSSPLLRASQSAEILAESLGLSIEYDPLWMERDNGRLAGLSFAEGVQRYPPPAFIHPYLPIGETGESNWMLYLRAGQAVQSLIARPPGCYLVVSHGAILNMVLYAMLGIVPQANFQGARFRFLNTSYAVLHYTPAAHKWLLERLNDRSHWEGGDSEE
jgi:2,3-bisphosphoglycerate-dependent phosphoglycerate mutase